MKYLCSVCQEETFHNEKLGIHFCKEHGMTAVPDIVKTAKAEC